MTISDDDLDRLMQALEGESETWLSGRFDADTGFTQAEDMSIFGPFGGPSPPISGSELLALQKAASRQFEEGACSREVVKTIVSGDIAVIVLIERNQVRLAGASRMQPWVLRTTSVFRLDEDGRWFRLHRHADPLIHFRPGEAYLGAASDMASETR